MKLGVVIFPGSNCDEDIIYVLENITNQKVEKLWHKEASTKGVDLVIIPGGFSYGNLNNASSIAKASPVMSEVIKHASQGKYVFGISSGFQLLAESGLLDGSLLPNLNNKFICTNTFIKPYDCQVAITKGLNTEKALKIPIATNQGRFFAKDEILKKIQDKNQIIFKYCNAQGADCDSMNPTESMQEIAGICNENKNVFGMIPLPERAANHNLANEDGKLIFESLLKYC